MPKRVAVYILLLLMALILPNGCGKPQDNSAEKNAIDRLEDLTKEGIHDIYRAVWVYKLDHGCYPEMIYGGDKEGWDFYNAHLPAGKEHLTDPLIEGGYLKTYPTNPFMRPGSTIEKSDVSGYRKGIEEFQKALASGPFDPRFGAQGDKMGNAMLPTFIFLGPGPVSKPKHLRLCPGQFFYSTYGDYNIPDKKYPSIDESPLNWKPGKYEAYMIGAFGALDTDGGDVIRWTDINGYVPPEYPHTYEDQFYIPHLETGVYVPLRLPELYGGGHESLLPMWPPWGEQHKIIAGAPDGFRDGIFFVVDWSGRIVVDTKGKKKVGAEAGKEGEAAESAEQLWTEEAEREREKEKERERAGRR
jgi:hypothetical protein